MLAPLRRALRLLRLALVCLTLVWSSAPASPAPVTDTIVMVAATRSPAVVAAPQAVRRPRAGDLRRETRRGEGLAAAATATTSMPEAGGVAAARAPPPPRRLYLEQRALLC